MTAFSERTEYAYAVGRIRSLERTLLDRTTLLRLFDEPLPGVCRLLEERGYPPIGEFCGGMPQDRDESFISPQFADFRDRCLADTFGELDTLSGSSEVTQLLPLRYDCLNLAWVLKARIAAEPVPRLFRCGTINPDDLQRHIDDEGRNLRPPLQEAYRVVQPLIEAGSGVRLIGCRVIGTYWRHYLRVARRSELPFLRLMATYHIDGVNLSTLARLKSSGEASLARFDDELVPAPSLPGEPEPLVWEPVGLEPLPHSFFRRAWGEPLEQLPNLLAGTHYERGANEAVSTAGGFSPLVFDRHLDDLIGRLIREARIATFGIEPLLAYGVAREIEISNLKILLGGRAVGLKAERIHEELRCTYV